MGFIGGSCNIATATAQPTPIIYCIVLLNILTVDLFNLSDFVHLPDDTVSVRGH